MKAFKNSFYVFLITVCATAFMQSQEAVAQNLDVPYVPTGQEVVDAMLELGKVTKDDVLYDLGCGDGRIVVTAAKKYGTKGTGVDIDPERIQEANANAREANVTDKVRFVEGNLFDVDLRSCFKR